MGLTKRGCGQMVGANTHLTHWDGNWSYRSKIMADAEAAEKCGLFQTVVF